MRNVLLFVNGKLGLGVVDSLLTQSDIKITGVVMNNSTKRSENYISALQNLSPTLQLFEYSEELSRQFDFQRVLNSSDFAISALFGHIIPSDLIKPFGPNFINLHPSLLPIGRGADPIGWAIIENKPQGVTLHVLEKELDSGPIISQHKITTTLAMTAGDIYELAMVELLRLFKEFVQSWPNVATLAPQAGESSFHKSVELRDLRNELERGSHELEKSVRIIQALTFADGRTPRLRLSNGELWEISLSMSRVVD
jgi:methionyl-tRNA formyltransferase